MFRTVFTPENESELVVTLPKEYLLKEVEVIAFDINNEVRDNPLQNIERRKRILKAIENLPKVDLSNFKFDRDEANER